MNSTMPKNKKRLREVKFMTMLLAMVLGSAVTTAIFFCMHACLASCDDSIIVRIVHFFSILSSPIVLLMTSEVIIQKFSMKKTRNREK